MILGLYWVPGHAGVQGNEIIDKLTRDSSVQKFVGPELSLGVSRQNIRKKIKRMDKQHLARWQGLKSTQTQTQELISGPSLTAKTKLLSFNKTQSRVVTSLLTEHNILTRHLHLTGLTNSPLYRRCEAEDETSAHILCEREALVSLRHVYLGSFFLDPVEIKNLSLGAIWNLSKRTGLPGTSIRLWGTRGPFLKPRCVRTIRAQAQLLINQSIS